MTRSTIQGSPGLHTGTNPETAPPGSLQQALGVVIKRPGIIQQTRPWRQYSSGADSAGYPPGNARAYSLAFLGNYFYQLNSLGQMFAESAVGSGVFNKLTTLPFAPANADANDQAIRVAESLGNWYMPFSLGMLKFDTAGGTGYRAGCPKALDPQLTLVASGSLLASGQSVAYRCVWKRIDANNNLVLGAPSGRVQVTGTAAQNVSVKAFLPQQVLNDQTPTAYYIQVYRTLTFAGTPDDEEALVYDAQLTATDVANTYATFADSTPDNMRGAALYTSPSQQGIAAANDIPPIGQDVAYFKGSLFISNTKQKHRAHIAMLGPPDQWAIQSIAANTPMAGQSTYTFPIGTDFSNISVYLAVTGTTGGSNDGTWTIVSVNAGFRQVVVTNAGVAQAGAAGTAMSGAIVITQAATLTLYPIYAAESVANKQYSIPSSGSVSTIVQSASASFCRIINQQAAANIVAYVESGPDDPPGLILIEEAAIGGGSFTVATNNSGSFASKWAPSIPTVNPLVSVNDAWKNRLYYSKSGQPEHVPIPSYLDIGSQNGGILRILGLREALLVFKEDGLFRVTGTAGSFSWAPYDLTQKLVNKAFATTIQNKAAALTTKGLFLFSEIGFQYLSAPVADIISRYTATGLSGGVYVANVLSTLLNGAASGLSASEGDGLLYLSLLDLTQTQASILTYSLTTGAWTQQPTTATALAANMNPIKWRDYRAAVDCLSKTPDVWVEDQWSAVSSAFTFGAAPGESFSEIAATGNLAAQEPVPGNKGQISISNVNAGAKQITATVQAFTLAPALAVNSVVRTNNNVNSTGSFYRVTAVNGSILTLAILLGPDNFDFVVGRGYQYWNPGITVEWNPYTADDEAMLKQWAEVAPILAPLSTPTAKAISVGAWTENFPAASITMQAIANASTYERAGLQKETQVSRRLSVRMQHSNPLEYIFIKGITYEYEVAEDDRATN